MVMKDFAFEVYKNAVEHGFWESDNIAEKVALVHCEVSEVMECYRNREPMCWRTEDGKLEGIATELADVCIRILDLMGHAEYPVDDYAYLMTEESFADSKPDLPELCLYLHHMIDASFYKHSVKREELNFDHLNTCLIAAMKWAYLHRDATFNGNMAKLMQEKHAYNVTRPYKHGKRC